MNIGFDGKRVFQNRSGLGNYSRTLISILAQYYPQHAYSIFAARQTDLFDINKWPNMNLVTPTGFLGKALPALWRRSLMVKDIAASGVHIFHGLSNELPAGIERIAVKKAVTVHDIIYERFPETYHADERLVNRKKIKKACHIADVVIAVSEQTKADLIELYKIPGEKIIVSYQSCNPIFQKQLDRPALDEIKKRYHLPDSYFLFVSSITKRKNLITLCKSMVALKDKCSIPLVLIGDGNKEKEAAKQYMKENGIEDRLIFLNELPQAKQLSFTTAADFPAIYQQATALIYPSVFEGFGIPVLEALWSGLPVICSDSSSLPEVGGNAASYFPALDHEALADRMMSVATNKTMAGEMRTKGFEQARLFADENYAAKIMQLYQNL